MYVPTFQGLAATDFVRSERHGAACYPFNAPGRLPFYRARNAIYHLFRALQTDKVLTVLTPEYNSGNEVLAMRAAGASIRYYPVGADGHADPDVVHELCKIHKPEVLYVIHYLGWPQPMRELTALCRHQGVLLVEDCALALLSELEGQRLGSFGDWSVFCLYKTLPVPNGALLVQNTIQLKRLEDLCLRRASLASVAGRTAELVVQRIRSRSNGVGATLQAVRRSLGRAAGTLEMSRSSVGDIGFALADVDLAMSKISTQLLNRLDFEAIRRRRVENFRYLAERLGSHATAFRSDLPNGMCPLFYPLLVPNKHATADALRHSGIEALEFWNEGADAPGFQTSAATRYLRDHVLGLPIHQDLTPLHLDHMARHVSGLNLRMAA